MPMFTNNTKIAAKQIDTGLVALGVALTLEAAYEDSQWGDTPFDGSRMDYVESLREEDSNDDWTDGYDEYRAEMYDAYHDSVICEGEDNTLECPM